MASSINPSNIDGTYPVAGQDNDSQGFRDNFSNIKTNFTAAKNEIEALQTTSVSLSSNNNFSFSGVINQAILQNVAESVVALGTISGPTTIDVSAGMIHTATFSGSVQVSFNNWPTSGKGSKVRLYVSITDISHTLTLPTEATLAVDTITGIDLASSIITFTATGTYVYDFSTIDGGTNILVEDLTQTDSQIGNISIIENRISATNTNGDINIHPDGTGAVVIGNTSGDGLTLSDTIIASFNSPGALVDTDIILHPKEVINPGSGGSVVLAGTTATIKTSSTNQSLTLSPDGTGVVNVPAGYKDRAGFGTNSLASKEYVDLMAGSGSITSIPLRHGLNVGIMSATQANPVVITTSDIPPGGTDRTFASATNTNPVRVTTNGDHNLSDRDLVIIDGVVGMTQLNGLDFYVDVISATVFDLYTDVTLTNTVDGTAYGVYASGGEVDKFLNHNLENGTKIVINSVVGMTELNTNNYYVNKLTDTTFELYDDSLLATSTDGTAFTAYTENGIVTIQEEIVNGNNLSITGGNGISVGMANDKYVVSLNSNIFDITTLQADTLELDTGGGGAGVIQTPNGTNADISVNPNGTGTVIIGGTTPTITTASGDLKLDSAGGDIVYDADIELSSSSNGTIKTSGTNQNIILDPNGTGVVSIAGDGTDATIATNTLNESLELAPNGTGAIKLTVDATTHISTAATTGAASSLPTDPAGYLAITINGTAYKIPYYNT